MFGLIPKLPQKIEGTLPFLSPKLKVERFGSLLTSNIYEDIKDPCPVFDGTLWHIFGSGGVRRLETWQILHATSPDLFGPWTEQPTVYLEGVKGNHVAAPGVVF